MKVAFYNTFARSSSELFGISTVCLAILAGGYLVVNRETHLFWYADEFETIECWRDSDVLWILDRSIGSSEKALSEGYGRAYKRESRQRTESLKSSINRSESLNLQNPKQVFVEPPRLSLRISTMNTLRAHTFSAD